MPLKLISQKRVAIALVAKIALLSSLILTIALGAKKGERKYLAVQKFKVEKSRQVRRRYTIVAFMIIGTALVKLRG